MAITRTTPRPPPDRAAPAREAGRILPGLLLLTCVLLSGCATAGPNHIYTVSSARSEVVRDTGPTAQVEIPSFIAADEELTGLAYDPFTDHLFLRLAPGNLIRVVDRPARQIKREFVIDELPATGGGDLAIRPRDGHVFFVVPDTHTLVETNRFGDFVRRIPLDGLKGRLAGVAYDTIRHQFWVLEDGHYPQLHVYDLEGKHLSATGSIYEGARGHLAYDSDKREIFVAAVKEALIARLNEQGKMVEGLPTPDGHLVEFIDVGPRSFVRVF